MGRALPPSPAPEGVRAVGLREFFLRCPLGDVLVCWRGKSGLDFRL